jgi:inorganic pyrophosphatase
MRIDAISIGQNPPDDVNVIIEVPVGGQPIKKDLEPGKWVRIGDWLDSNDAKRLITEAIERAKSDG